MKYSLKSGQKTVATAGTQLALSSSGTWARNLYLAAPAANAGAIYIGDSNVDSATGYAMAPGASVALSSLLGHDIAVYLDDIYVDAANNGDKVTFLYLENKN